MRRKCRRRRGREEEQQKASRYHKLWRRSSSSSSVHNRASWHQEAGERRTIMDRNIGAPWRFVHLDITRSADCVHILRILDLNLLAGKEMKSSSITNFASLVCLCTSVFYPKVALWQFKDLSACVALCFFGSFLFPIQRLCACVWVFLGLCVLDNVAYWI